MALYGSFHRTLRLKLNENGGGDGGGGALHEGFPDVLLESGAQSAGCSHFRPIRRFHRHRLLTGLPPRSRQRTLGIPNHTQTKPGTEM